MQSSRINDFFAKMNAMTLAKTKLCLLLAAPLLLCQCEKDDSDTTPPSPNYADSVKAGLWAHYTFDGTLADQSGNNHNGTGYNNIQFTYDIWGNDNKALNFNGTNNYVSIEDGKQFPEGDFSISFLLMPRTIHGGRVFQKADITNAKGASAGIGFDIGTFSPQLVFNISKATDVCNSYMDLTTSTPLTVSNNLQPYAWYYVTCKFEKNIMKAYYNGNLVATLDRSNEVSNHCTSAPFNLGIWWLNDLKPLDGKLDEFRIYTRGLSEDEIKYLARSAMN